MCSVVTAALGAVGCAVDTPEAETTAFESDDSDAPVFLEQGWSATLRSSFYQTTQGSRMLPYDWFLQLEQATSRQKFRAASNMRRMGFLVDDRSDANPDRLPVGFAKDVHPTRGDALGLTCAACHTGELEFAGQHIRIDGGQSLGDIEQLQNGLLASLTATLADHDKFERFAENILGDDPTDDAEAALRAQVDQVRAWWAGRVTRSAGLTPHGPSRTDAFTIIGNEVVCALFADPRNCEVPIAPTQFPFLWSTPDFDWVQYNSSVHSPLGRNVGEVTGVFAEAQLDAFGVNSTANLTNLNTLENWLKLLRAPAWPEALLGSIDGARAAQGEAIYATACASCHPVVAPRTGPNRFGLTFARVDFSTPLSALGTDSTAAFKFATRRAFPGPFTAIAQANGLIGPDGKASVAALLSISGKMIIERFFAAMGFTDLQKLAYLGFRESLSPTIAQLTTYKARPLAGVAFTAPYLHNGSVPSVYQLLLPPAERTKQFWVGNRAYDPVNLGYSTERVRGAVLLDTTQVGNGNGGHVYGTTLSHAERLAVIEYLKTL